MIKPTKTVDLRHPLREHPRWVRWDLYDFEGISDAKPPASCWQTFTLPAQEFYESYGDRKQLRAAQDFIGSLRHGWRRRKRSRNRVEELVEIPLAEYQHPTLQYGLTTPHRDFWALEKADTLTMDRWEMADRVRGLHLLVVEVEQIVGLVPLDEATPWHMALAYPLLGYLPPALDLELWAEAVLYLDTPNIRRVREAWVEKHKRIIRRSRRVIDNARAWVPEREGEQAYAG
jgi:hypothetical protein